MTTSDESFLARWSRLKRQPAEPDIATSAAGERNPDEALSATRNGEVSADHESMPSVARPSANVSGPEKHPPVDFENFDFESLDFSSDYRPFMRDGVPQEARNKALRQLWASDPVFSTLDGLDDCCGDYTDAAVVPKTAVATAYKIGQGFLSDSEVREWEALGRPRETELAAKDDADTDADVSSDAGDNDNAEQHEETARTADPSADATAADAIDAAGCSSAACAAVVKKEELEALESYERPARTGKTADDA